MGTKKEFIRLLKRHEFKKPIIDAFESLDQEDFFDPVFRDRFYTEEVVPIGFGEESDQALTLAKMIQMMQPRESWRVLEIGTGSGYSTALLSRFVSEVVTIEYYDELAMIAKERLRRCGINHVRFYTGDGTETAGYSGNFDAVIVLASCQKRPLSLLNYLKRTGIIIFPMGPLHEQQIAVISKEGLTLNDQVLKTRFYDHCNFFPIKGKYGMIIGAFDLSKDPDAEEL